MMFFEGNIAAPPTITVFSSARAGATKVEVIASTLKAAAERNAIRLDMECLPIWIGDRRPSAGDEGSNDGAARGSHSWAPSLSRITGAFEPWFPEIFLC